MPQVSNGFQERVKAMVTWALLICHQPFGISAPEYGRVTGKGLGPAAVLHTATTQKREAPPWLHNVYHRVEAA
jgi:hypothetical protein